MDFSFLVYKGNSNRHRDLLRINKRSSEYQSGITGYEVETNLRNVLPHWVSLKKNTVRVNSYNNYFNYVT